MAKMKKVKIRLEVELEVPSDDEYDIESYFKALQTHITDPGDNYLTQASVCFEEVDSIKVNLINKEAGE